MMLSNEQVEIAVKFWAGLFKKYVSSQIDHNRFEKALRKIITNNRDIISTINLNVIPHTILAEALKLAKAHKYSFPFAKISISFDKDKVVLYHRDVKVKDLDSDSIEFAV